MDRLFTFLQTYRGGILVFFFSLAALAMLVQWFAWIFGIGRFGKDLTSGTKALSVAFSEATFKIINEFRHLLALLVFIVFAFALAYSLIKAASLPTDPNSPSTIDNMKEALQAVVATLGGLVGSIIGYYFGESSAGKGGSNSTDASGAKSAPEVQGLPPEGKASDITRVEKPTSKA